MNDHYLIEAPRAELLEQIFQLLLSVDAISEAKQVLFDLEEFEAWAELSALEYSLRHTAS
jgi:hypothetical protein